MRKNEAALFALAVVALLGAGVGAASAATPGFAVYSVELSSPGHSYNLTVNETVIPTSSPSSDTLVLKVASQSWNFDYSRSINSSSQVSPFLPAITNQSLSYGSGSTSVKVSVVKNGTISVQFGGASHTLTSYALSATASVNGTSGTIKGALSTFPSGLVYSLKISASGVNLNASAFPGLPAKVGGPAFGQATISLTLLSTSLPLNPPSASPAAQAASIGVGAGAAVTALALGLGVRHRRHKQSTPEKNPEYWVD